MIEKTSTLPDQRIYAVGDIHGRADLLVRLLDQIEQDAKNYPQKNKKIIFLGDYIDRGLDSKMVVDRLLQPFAEKMDPVFLRGNHDNYLLRFLKGDFDIALHWLEFGGLACLASYGVNVAGVPSPKKIQALHDELKEKIPSSHKAFFKDTLISVTFGDYFFTHAGARPFVPLDQQTDEDKMTIRGDFLFSDYEFESVIVHGHTIKTEPEIRPNRIGVDTGAYATGVLTCLILDGHTQQFLDTKS